MVAKMQLHLCLHQGVCQHHKSDHGQHLHNVTEGLLPVRRCELASSMTSLTAASMSRKARWPKVSRMVASSCACACPRVSASDGSAASVSRNRMKLLTSVDVRLQMQTPTIGSFTHDTSRCTCACPRVSASADCASSVSRSKMKLFTSFYLALNLQVAAFDSSKCASVIKHCRRVLVPEPSAAARKIRRISFIAEVP